MAAQQAPRSWILRQSCWVGCRLPSPNAWRKVRRWEVLQSCLTLGPPWTCTPWTPLGFSVHGILRLKRTGVVALTKLKSPRGFGNVVPEKFQKAVSGAWGSKIWNWEILQLCFLLCKEKRFALWEKTEAGAQMGAETQDIESWGCSSSWFLLQFAFIFWSCTGMWDLSSPTRTQTFAVGVQILTTGLQGSPHGS